MIRLFLSIILLLVSLLAVFKAPEYHLWMLAILVTEFPVIFVILTSILLFTGYKFDKYTVATTCTALISLMLFLSPIIRSWSISVNLKNDLDLAFDNHIPFTKKAFSVAALFKTSAVDEVPYQTLTYASYPSISLKLDYYSSASTGKMPCILVIHGGSWSSGDSQQLPELNSVLAREGYHVAALNYRMAPAYQNPAPVEDIRAALTYLKINSEKLKIDTSNFILLGRSAGAQIALLAAYTLQDPSIKGVIDFYGPADMVWGYSIPSNPLIMDSRNVMENYLGGTYQQVPQNYAASSPIAAIKGKVVPTLIIHGQNDVLVAYEHTIRLSRRLKEVNTDHFVLSLPWATHGFDYNLNGPGGQLSTYTILRFLSHLKRA